MFRRGSSYNTTVLPISSLLFYMGSNVIGIVYVNFSNLNNYRGNPLLNRDASYSSLFWTLALSPILYFASVMIVLRHPYSVSSQPCIEGSKSCVDKPYSWV
jgi:hypothetical protein